MTLNRLTLPKPDDWHVHLRDGPMLKAVLPATARRFGRAIVMPNLVPPVLTEARAREYRDEILRALPPDAAFTPLMTLFLTDKTDPGDLERGYREGVLTAAKYYPPDVTTFSQNGVTDMQAIAPVLERMQSLGMPLLMHGEISDPSVDIFDAHEVFIDRILVPLRRHFPALKIVLEHISTKVEVDYVVAEGQEGSLAATIAAHHLRLNRNALFKEGKLQPHYYCKPVLKRESDRQAVVMAATSGAPMFFLGTDSAPHPREAKEAAHSIGGVFTALNALELYAQVFAGADALDRLAAFASLNGPAFYGLPVNETTLELEELSRPASGLKPILTENGSEIIPFQDDAPPSWRVVE